MSKLLFCCLMLLGAATATQAQTWTRPANCPTDPVAVRSVFAAALQKHSLRAAKNNVKVLSEDKDNPQICGPRPGVCQVDVRVTPAIEGGNCFASIDRGLLNIAPGTRDPQVMWKLVSGCRPASLCKFDKVVSGTKLFTGGITVLEDARDQAHDPVFSTTAPHVYKMSSKNSVAGSFIKYDPHVFWRARPSDTWQSCCPIDPRIVNEGP